MLRSGRYNYPYRPNRRMMKTASTLPDTIRDAAHLDELLSTPTEPAIDAVRALDGDFLVLGAAGKMGRTLARMLRRALDAAGKKAKVTAVSRFPAAASEDEFKR